MSVCAGISEMQEKEAPISAVAGQPYPNKSYYGMWGMINEYGEGNGERGPGWWNGL